MIFQVVSLALLAVVVLADIRGMSARRGRLMLRVGRFLVCVLAAVLILTPNVTSQIATSVGIGRGTDLLLYVMLLISPLAWFHLQAQNAALERRLIQIARDESLRNPVRFTGD
ncbi:MAG: DUF2304 domain-containing protein [Planctomycetota bacterium]